MVWDKWTVGILVAVGLVFSSTASQAAGVRNQLEVTGNGSLFSLWLDSPFLMLNPDAMDGHLQRH